jgi:hypothetical protein
VAPASQHEHRRTLSSSSSENKAATAEAPSSVPRMCGEATAYARYGSYSVARPHKVRFAKSAWKAGFGNDASSPINGAKEPKPVGKPQTVGERSGRE